MSERKEGDTPRVAAQRGLRDTVQGTPFAAHPRACEFEGNTNTLDEMQRIVALGFEFKVGGYLSKQGIVMWVGHVAKDTENEKTVVVSHSVAELLEALVLGAKNRWPEAAK